MLWKTLNMVFLPLEIGLQWIGLVFYITVQSRKNLGIISLKPFTIKINPLVPGVH